MDLARSIQVVTEEIMLRMARAARSQTNEENLCLAGGVALNCVANGVDCALQDLSEYLDSTGRGGCRRCAGGGAFCLASGGEPAANCESGGDAMRGSYLGPSFSDADVQKFLAAQSLPLPNAGG